MGYSVAMTSAYRSQDFLEEPTGGRRGRLESFEFESEFSDKRTVTVYLPSGYDDAEDRYPVAFFTDGKGWIDKGKAPVALDNLIRQRVRPMIAVFVTRSEGSWWLEEGGSKTGDYARMLAEELVPQIDGRYRTRTRSQDRALIGADGAGFAAAYAALRRPDVFGKAAVQSIQLDGEIGDELLAMISAKERPDVDFYVDWNRYEIHSVDRGFDYAEYSRTFVAALEEHGYELTGGEAMDSYGWGSWRARTDDILAAFFPTE